MIPELMEYASSLEPGVMKLGLPDWDSGRTNLRNINSPSMLTWSKLTVLLVSGRSDGNVG